MVTQEDERRPLHILQNPEKMYSEVAIRARASRSKKYINFSLFLIDYFNNFIGHDFFKTWWLLKEPFVV